VEDKFYETQTVRRFLAWCLILNYGVLIIWFVVFIAAHDQIYDLHSRWFAITRSEFDVAMYYSMAIYKIGVMLFNLMPYLALRIMDAKDSD
jgi:hypothetical protein